MAEHRRKVSPRRFTTVGIEFIFVFLVFLGAGYLLDRLVHFEPVFMIWLGVVGFFVAMRRLLHQAKDAGRSLDEEQHARRGEDGY